MKKQMNRKEFFQTLSRYLLLGGITASAGYLVVNNKVTAKCTVSPACKKCESLKECEKPQAREEKDGKK